MKRVIYNTSNADPFIKVAQKLKLDYGYEPVYWIGFDYDNSEELVPVAFPGICYQSYANAWRGIFNETIQQKAVECYIDIDLLNELARYELQAIKMMDRMDFDRYSFNYMERERHFLNLIKSWLAVFDIYRPDIVIGATNPHRVYDYVLYILCKYRNIPFISLQYSMAVEWNWINTNIYSIGSKFDESYQKYLSKGGLTKENLPTEIKREFEKVMKDYSEAAPYWVADHERDSKKQFNIFSLAWIYFKKYNLFGKNGIIVHGKVPSLMRKRRGYSLEEGGLSLFDSIFQKLKQISYCKKMSKFYSSLTTMPKNGEKYIFCALHYQPEETTSPSGDIFVNQRLCVETILKNTPEDVFVYVKEHPAQFMPHQLGQTSRIKEFYTDLLKSPRVRLIPTETNSYDLIAGSIAVSTVIGTIGWETIMHRKPLLMFGMFWYERMPGVFRITNSASATGIWDFIQEYKYDEQKLLAYLMAFSENSIRCYQYDGMKERMNLPENECVDNIVNVIIKCLADIESN